MDQIKHRIIVFSIILFMLPVILTVMERSTREVSGEHGEINLENIYDSKEIYTIDGDWSFYWNQLLDNEDLENGYGNLTGFIRVPSVWNHFQGDESIGGKGYATYVLTIQGKGNQEAMYLEIPHFSTAYRVYIDNQEIAESGIISTNLKQVIGRYKRQVVSYKEPAKTYRLIVQIANKDYARGGFWYTLHISHNPDLMLIHYRNLVTESILIGVVFVLGLYHLYLFVITDYEKSELYLLLVFFMGFLRIGTTGELVLYFLFPELNYHFFVRFEYASFVLGVFFLISFVEQLLYRYRWKGIHHYFSIFTVLICISIICLPLNILTSFLWAYELVTTVYILYGIIIIVKAARAREKYIEVIILFVIFLLGVFISDTLYQANILDIYGRPMLSLFCMYVVLAQAILMGHEIKRVRQQKANIETTRAELFRRFSRMVYGPLQEAINHIEKNQEEEHDLKLLLYDLKGIVDDTVLVEKIKNEEVLPKYEAVDLENILNQVSIMMAYKSERQGKMENIPRGFQVYSDGKLLYQAFRILIDMLLGYNIHHVYWEIYRPQKSKAIFELNVLNERIQVDANIWKELRRLHILFESLKCFFEVNERKKTISFSFYKMEEKSQSIVGALVNEVEEVGESDEYRHQIETKTYTIGILSCENHPLAVEMGFLKESFHCVGIEKEVSKDSYKTYGKGVDAYLVDVTQEKANHSFIENIRKLYSPIELPVIAVKDYEDSVLDVDLIRAGYNEVVTRPVHALHLKQRIDYLLSIRNQAREFLQLKWNMMQLQIRPHFIQNTLNSIISLLDESPEEAENLLFEFSDYLRSSLIFYDDHQWIRLERELDYVNHYVNIERVRFKDAIELHVLGDNNDIKIPPLTIQPLVENSIKHNLNRVQGKIIVRIEVARIDDAFEIAVSDNGCGVDIDNMQLGTGLSNINRRLEYFCGSKLKFESQKGKGLKVYFRVTANRHN